MSSKLHDAVQLLVDARLGPDERITQTDAREVFCLELSDLSGLDHVQRSNKCNPRTPMKLFVALDIAQRALEVHGGTSCSLVGSREKISQLKEQRRAVEDRRDQVKADMAKRSAERAALFVATTPAQRLCKRLQIDPNSELPKTKAKEKFNLEDHQLHGLLYSKQSNPRNSRWAAMKLYKAEDVAARALQFGTMGDVDEPKTPQ